LLSRLPDRTNLQFASFFLLLECVPNASDGLPHLVE
jgi:hypothetical protein